VHLRLVFSLFLDSPIRGGSWLVSELFLGFGSVFVFELSAVYVPVTLVFKVNYTAVVEFKLLVPSFKEESLVCN